MQPGEEKELFEEESWKKKAMYNSSLKSKAETRDVTAHIIKLWPNGVMPYVFTKNVGMYLNFDPTQQVSLGPCQTSMMKVFCKSKWIVN